MRFDLSQPAQLSGALGPDLVLMGGAMLLLLWAGWRRESDAHQRNVGILSILVCIITKAVTGIGRGKCHLIKIAKKTLSPR